MDTPNETKLVDPKRGANSTNRHIAIVLLVPLRLIRGESQYSQHAAQQPSITLPVG